MGSGKETKLVHIRMPVDLIGALDERRWQLRSDSRNELVVELLKSGLEPDTYDKTSDLVATLREIVKDWDESDKHPSGVLDVLADTVDTLRAALRPFDGEGVDGE